MLRHRDILRLLAIVFICFATLVALTLAGNRAWAADEWLTLSVNGASPELEQNIRAHLGNLPDSNIQRQAYLFNVEDNVNAALQSMGFYHGVVTESLTKNDKGPWKLTLSIDAGTPTVVQWVDINFAGEMLEDDAFEQWLSTIKLKPGDILNHGVYENIKSQLATLAIARGYFDGGYIQSEIKINRDLNTAQLTLHYDSGDRYHLGSVDFTGHTLDNEILEKLVPFELDAPYSTRRIGNLNSQLNDVGYFSNIKVMPQLDKTEDHIIPILVELEPKPDHSIELGLGADIGASSDKSIDPRVKITWRTPQINHYGHSQETSLEWSRERPKFLTSYSIPLSHPLNDLLKFRVGLLQDKYGVTQEYSPEDRDFFNTGQLESTKKLFNVLRQQKLKNQWIWNYSIEATREIYTQFGVDYNPRFFLFGTNISNTYRGDNSLDPKSGFRQIYSVEYADPNLGSTIRLTRLQAKFKWIDTFFDNHRLVARLDLGVNIAEDSELNYIPPSLRYFAGGDQSIRGYGYQELGPYSEQTDENKVTTREVIGGSYLTVGSIEYQYYVTPTWRVASFIDAGNAFDANQVEPIYSVGGGIHWISPIGPIKLDVGVGLKETETVERSWRIHLTMGTEL